MDQIKREDQFIEIRHQLPIQKQLLVVLNPITVQEREAVITTDQTHQIEV